MTQFRTHVFATHSPWVYRGVLHEYPALQLAPGIISSPPLPTLPGALIHARAEGARSRNPHKYADDASVLEREIARNPSDSRALFYCAQSWRDAGNAERAVELYRRVAASPLSWLEERYIACLNVVRLGRDAAVVQEHAFLAPTFNSRRREVTTAWLMRTRLDGAQWTQAMLALAVLMMVTTPDEPNSAWLFVEPDVYAWRAGDEASLCAFYTGQKPLARKYMEQILPRVPDAHRSRILENIRLCDV
jgi:hypothetical protein